MKSVRVNTDTPYEVKIGSGIISELGENLAKLLTCKNLVIISDETVDKLYGQMTETVLCDVGFSVSRYAFPVGEHGKNLETVSKILEFLAENGVTRSDCLVALGGGITGDITGFCAAVYQRGMDFVQVPTTLLAAVDSSVGGKTGVNLAAGKNLAGAFWQQRLVQIDTDLLKTLPDEIFADGAAEIIKYGVLEDKDLFDMLKTGSFVLEDVIARCVEIKAKYVAVDERDMGERQKLNLGHTFAHAIEKASDYSVPHGSAVAIGMVMAAKAANILGVSGRDLIGEISTALDKNCLPTYVDISPEKLLPVMAKDKKREGDKVKLILPVCIGKCITKSIPAAELLPLLKEVCKWR